MLKLKPFNPLIVDLQASRILARLGGVNRFCQVLRAAGIPRCESSVRRWTQPRSIHGGTGGLIPYKSTGDVLLVAKLEGIELTASDWYVEPRRYVEDGEGYVVPDKAQEKRMLEATLARERQLERAERARQDPHGLRGTIGRPSIYKRWQ